MSTARARVRMFAGPNGSGKSTLKAILPRSLLGVYLNPDEIELAMRRDGFLDLRQFETNATGEELLGYFTASDFLVANGLAGQLKLMKRPVSGCCFRAWKPILMSHRWRLIF